MYPERDFQEELDCAHAGCDCTFLPSEGFEYAGQLYCCQGCAEGEGCEHLHCNCSLTRADLYALQTS